MLELHASKRRPCSSEGRGCWRQHLLTRLREGRYARIAAELGTTEAAVQQAASRLRRRYRAALREEIAATLDEPDEAAIDDEVRALFAALGG
jgi:hypothetical protein